MRPPLAPAGNGVAFVLGTRPEMVKLAPVAALFGDDARLIHTGQHYDPSLSADVWSEAGLRGPESLLDVGGLPRAAQVGRALTTLGEIFAQRRPAAVVVQGDTNATLAGALAANAVGVPLVHVEAGLRSFDRGMPEEHNRILVDHISDLLCAPTEVNRENLLAENVSPSRILVTGNTVVEALAGTLPDPHAREAILARYGLAHNGFVLATIHRPENTDDRAALTMILTQLGRLNAPVVLALHPRTRARIEQFTLTRLLEPLTVIPPQTPADFLALAAESSVLVSDSGGIQEECSVLKRPLLVIRASTERPEVMGTFAERVTPSREIADIVNEWLDELPAIHARLAALPSPYGNGDAARLIAEGIRRLLEPAP